jgi:retron-type reverse transcriptase
MDRVSKRISDKRLLRLIRAYLNAGVMENGLVGPTDEGVPQGGPLSPLLSNLVLDEFDLELTHRGLRFCRYADDCNIYVGSRRSGERVMVRSWNEIIFTTCVVFARSLVRWCSSIPRGNRADAIELAAIAPW